MSLLAILLCLLITAIPAMYPLPVGLSVLGTRMNDPRPGRCVDTMHLPCFIGHFRFEKVRRIYGSDSDCNQVFQVLCTNNQQIYIMKLSRVEHSPRTRFECVLDEIEVTKFMQKETKHLKPPRSITVHHCERKVVLLGQKTREHRVVMVMDYAPLGRAFDIQAVASREHLAAHRDEFVMKLINDQSRVLSTMWQNHLIDRDFKLENIVMFGNMSRPFDVTFVKIDYGACVKVSDARIQLSSNRGRVFFHYGTNVCGTN